MKLYCVFGVEWHVFRELLGIYDSEKLAISRRESVKELNLFDEIIINEIELNANLEYL